MNRPDRVNQAWSMNYPGAVSVADLTLASQSENAAAVIDAPVAAHFGDFYREQRRWIQGQAVIDRSHHGVVQVSGPQRLTWLHSLLTQDMSQWDTQEGQLGQAVQALLLTPQGHVQHHLRVFDDGQRTWLLTEPGEDTAIARFLGSMIFRADVTLQVASDQWALMSAHPSAEKMLQQLRTLPGVGPSFTLTHHRQGQQESSAASWVELLVPRDLAEGSPLVEHDQLAGVWAFEAWRVQQGIPRAGVDTDHRSIPHEMGWIGSAVALDKGCYRGQETVARVHNLGRPPRRLVRLHLDGMADELPTQGTPILLAPGPDGETDAQASTSSAAVGFVGTVVRHYELGPVALAVVKRSLQPDAPLMVQGVAATQELIVAADAGPAVKVPRLGSLASRGLAGVKPAQ